MSSKYHVGDILNSDMSVTTTKVSGKTPVGVVFDPIRQLAVSLEQNPTRVCFTGDVEDFAGLKTFPVEEFPYSTSKEASMLDFNGKANTKKILETCKKYKMECTIPYYVENYHPAGTSGWYIPAGGEILSLHNAKDEVRTALSKLSATPLDKYYWSSTFTKVSYGSAWDKSFRTDLIVPGSDGWSDDSVQWWNVGFVRPIIKF